MHFLRNNWSKRRRVYKHKQSCSACSPREVHMRPINEWQIVIDLAALPPAWTSRLTLPLNEIIAATRAHFIVAGHHTAHAVSGCLCTLSLAPWVSVPQWLQNTILYISWWRFHSHRRHTDGMDWYYATEKKSEIQIGLFVLLPKLGKSVNERKKLQWKRISCSRRYFLDIK